MYTSNKYNFNIKNFYFTDIGKNFLEEYSLIFKRNYMHWIDSLNNFKELNLTLSSVDISYLDEIIETKILLYLLQSAIWDVLESKDDKFLNDVLKILRNNIDLIKYDDKKIFFISQLWNYILERIGRYPRFKEFQDAFIFDFHQTLNSLEYSLFAIRHPEVINPLELDIYSSYSSTLFTIHDIDLMVSPKFKKDELSNLRKIFWYAQQMIRINISITRWKNEIKKHWYMSDIFAHSISKNILQLTDIQNLCSEEIINKIEKSGVLYDFFDKWRSYYLEINSLKGEIKSVDIDSYLKTLKKYTKILFE